MSIARRTRTALLTTVAVAALATFAPVADAVPPSNDDWELADAINGGNPPVQGTTYNVSADTDEATEQDWEFTQCGDSVYGKTVWWDIFPNVPGWVFVTASGYDAVIGTVPWDSQNLYTNEWFCDDDPSDVTTESAAFFLDSNRSHSIQIGGFAGYASDGADESTADSGLVEVKVTFYADRDRDGILEAPAQPPDRCPEQQGTAANQGCGDRDVDGIVDPDDQCIDQKGSARHAGCPDTDGDDIADRFDNCDLLGGSSNLGGCPDADQDDVRDASDSGGQVDRCIGENAAARNRADANRDGCIDVVNLSKLVDGGVKYDPVGGALKISRVRLAGVPDRLRVRIAGLCQRRVGRRFQKCGSVARTTAAAIGAASTDAAPRARAARNVTVRGLVRGRLGVGSRITLRVTAFKAIGKYIRWTVVRKAGELTTSRIDGCMNQGERVRYKRRGCS